jgi:hypothetical protein
MRTPLTAGCAPSDTDPQLRDKAADFGKTNMVVAWAKIDKATEAKDPGQVRWRNESLEPAGRRDLFTKFSANQPFPSGKPGWRELYLGEKVSFSS